MCNPKLQQRDATDNFFFWVTDRVTDCGKNRDAVAMNLARVKSFSFSWGLGWALEVSTGLAEMVVSWAELEMAWVVLVLL